MRKLRMDLEAIDVTSFQPVAAAGEVGLLAQTLDCTTDCMVTGGVDSCWCSEYHTCDCV